MLRVHDIREHFVDLFAHDKTVAGTLEIVGATFEADEPTIFGNVNEEYVAREIQWYESMSLSVDDIPGGPPAIWRQISSRSGRINSNYGYLFFSGENGGQIKRVVEAICENIETRRAIAIYTRPSIHAEWDFNGMHDFICTNAVQYLVRDGKLEVVVQMRSNDVVFGYRNDLAWQRHAQRRVIEELGSRGVSVDEGRILWNVASLHVYERHFHLVEAYWQTGNPYLDVSR